MYFVSTGEMIDIKSFLLLTRYRIEYKIQQYEFWTFQTYIRIVHMIEFVL